LTGPGFDVAGIEDIRLRGPADLARKRLMSPYVWRDADRFRMLFRVVDDAAATTGSLWLAQGDGLDFTADEAPLIVPGPQDFDAKGCEDPTVVHVDDGCLVYYTGVQSDGVAQLLWAQGPDIRSLGKRGVAHPSTPRDHNTKEAAVERRGAGWLLLFEYSCKGHSRIGRAEADGPSGPWAERPAPLAPRPGGWDGWHLSTGPILIDDPNGPIMFYNGANEDAVWQIGWVRFDEMLSRPIDRCGAPLVEAPKSAGPDGHRVAFAASVVASEDELWLYFTHNDRSLRRARLRRPRP